MAAIVPDTPLATDAYAEVKLAPATNAAFSLFVFWCFFLCLLSFLLTILIIGSARCHYMSALWSHEYMIEMSVLPDKL